jgi:hypothetical protein
MGFGGIRKIRKQAGVGENFAIRSFMTFILCQGLLGSFKRKTRWVRDVVRIKEKKS